MIKIFEALQKAQDEISDIVLPAVFEEPGGAAEAARQPRAASGVTGRSLEAAAPASPADRKFIFEALRKSQDEISDMMSPAVFEEPGGAAEAARQLRAVPGVAGRSLSPADRKTIVRSAGLTLSAKDPLFPLEGAAGEQYRIIRTKLMQHPKQPRMIGIVSPGPGDGKTVTSINLAGTLSLKKGAEVLLIDCDLRRSKIAEVLGLPPEPGLADVLGREARLEDVMVQVEQFPNLYVIPAGKTPANPGELLDSQRWLQLCAEIRGRFQFIIVDTPPIGPVTDYDLIQAACDGVVLVLRPDHTKRSAGLEALKTVAKEKLLGVITNAVEDWFLKKTQSYYYSANIS